MKQVLEVKRGSPGDLAGICEGDNIVSIDGKAATPDSIAALIVSPTGHLGSSCRLQCEASGVRWRSRRTL